MNAVCTIGSGHHVWRRLLAWCCLVVMFLFTTTALSAHDNEYGLSPEMYELYHQCDYNSKTYLGMQLAHMMYKRAKELGDKRGQCFALRAMLLCESQKMLNDEAVDNAMARLQNFAAKNGFWDEYHHATFYKCFYLSRNRRRLDALHYIEKTQNDAMAAHSALGIYYAYCNTGLVRLYRNEYHHSQESYKQAIEYAKKNLPDMDLGATYVRIALCYEHLNDPKKMLEYSLEGKKATHNSIFRVRLQRAICYSYYLLDNKAEFKEAYNELQDMGMRNVSEDHDYDDSFLDVLNCLFDKDYATAKAILDKLPDSYYKKGVLKDYYVSKGDYKNATTTFEAFFKQHLAYHDSLSFEDIEWYENISQIHELQKEKILLQKRNIEMELSNTQLQLSNSDMELSQIKDRENIAKMDAENANLIYNNRKLEAHKLQQALKYQKLKNEAFKQKTRMYRMTYTVVFTVLTIILVIIIVSSLRTYNVANKLQAVNNELDEKNRQLAVAYEKAEEANRLKTVFLQNMTHELRTPLNAIMGFSTILSYGMEDGEEDKAVMDEAIKTNSALLETLVDDIVGFAEMEGNFPLNIGTYNILELCHEALSTIKNRLPSKVPLVLDSSDVAPSMSCVTDGPRVQRVLVNMLTNAIKNTEEGSIRLCVSMLTAPGMVTFSVTDTGIGVPSEYAEEIFERFKKIDEFKQGSGLGLSICRLIATKLDGSIWLDTHHHPGARFVFQIPVFYEKGQDTYEKEQET